VDRGRVTRWAAPVAFLAAITIGALVVRAGLDQGRHHHGKTPSTTVTSTTKKKTHGHRAKVRKYYTVVLGDTLASIAAKTGTTVDTLKKLNPGIDPTALQVGQKIRVQ
jgi:predicted house-cleaning NTP pyrophosphatase (Maf/HAM1 superfamily)